MESEFADKSNPTSISTPNVQPLASADFEAVKSDAQASLAPSVLSTSGMSSWHRSLNILQPLSAFQEDSGESTFARLTGGLGSKISPKASAADDTSKETLTAAHTGFIGSFTKGLVDSSRNAVKAVQVKARHVVSQNKRRYQEGEFDLDMTYITNNIIAMGFPAGDMSSGFFGFVEGLYRNHMEEVIKFFETRHKGKYKVYNLCSERLYDASLFEGKVASFPFDDHNCPPIQLIISFCHSAHTWLKQDTENVVAVHCKAGKARTGLMISSLLLFLKFSPSAEECINYYNQKRCFDGKGLVLPSQIRYVKYFERLLMHFNGQNQPGRRCMLRGLRLHSCPYWVRPAITVSDHNGVLFTTKKHPRTKDLSPEDFWISAPKKGIIVFALPGEPGLTELTGDFKIHFHERQGDFYCWLNTAMIENRKTLTFSDLDWFDKRKLPSPGFQVEVVMMDYDGRSSKRPPTGAAPNKSLKTDSPMAAPSPIKNPGTQDKDELSDSETEKTGPPKVRKASSASAVGGNATEYSSQTGKFTRKTEQITLGKKAGPMHFRPAAEQKRVAAGGVPVLEFDVPGSTMGSSEFKEMAADASVFTFGDEEDYDSDAIDLK